MGAGGSLGAFVRQQAAASGSPVPPGVASLPHQAEDVPDAAFVLASVGRLWTVGVRPGPAAFGDAGTERRVPLPSALPEATESAGPEAVDGADEGSEVERVLAGVWHELLEVRPSRHDDFFLLGGHSLLAAKLIARVRDRFGVDMRLRTLFQTRTVAGMATWIEEAAAAG
jgi:acyl carrier protein